MLGAPGPAIVTIFFIPLLLYLYVRHNDKKITYVPDDVAVLSGHRFTSELVQAAANDFKADPVAIGSMLPPKTGRRYIIVGGSGFLAHSLILHLLQRGEDPRRIRVVDICSPVRLDSTGIEYVQANIADHDSLRTAFMKQWQQFGGLEEPEITVFNVAASIRFFERHPSLIPLSAEVNITGSKNVIDSSHACGATILCTTSSGSVGVRSTRFLLMPWEEQPAHFVQVLRDDDDCLSRPHESYFSNYAYTKARGEKIVRSADRSVGAAGKILRTGCIRPGNGIYGIGDMMFDMHLRNKVYPTWAPHIVQNHIHVENCSLAHLCYEQRLLELNQGGNNPDIGGQAFIVTDAGPPISYGDSCIALNVLTNGKTAMLFLSPTAMLFIAYIVEAYYLFTHWLDSSTFVFSQLLRYVFPRIPKYILGCQPSIWSLINSHLVFDGSRAMAPPEQGGLGYNPPLTSLRGLCHLAQARQERADGKSVE